MVTKKKVIILGASRYYKRSIEASLRAGYHVIAVDKNPESEGFLAATESFVCDIVDQEGILALAKARGIHGIVPVNDYGVPTAAYVSSCLGLSGISAETALLATNKELMRQRWLDVGVPCPRVEVALTFEEIALAAKRIGYPCILKPAHGIGGASRGVVVVKNEGDLAGSIEFSQSFYQDKTTLVESFVLSEFEHSAEVLIHKGKAHVIAISDKVKTPLPYRVDKCVLYPTAVRGKRREGLEATIRRAVEAIGISCGAAHVELATTAEGFILFELGARCGGGGTPEPIVPFVTGVNLFVELVRILVGDEPKNLEPLFERGCNYHFVTLKPGVIRSISGFDKLERHGSVLDAELFVKPGQVVPEVKVGGDRSGFIIIGEKTREGAYKTGIALEDSLVVDYC